MSSIKKNFVEIYNLLNANQDALVSDIMDLAIELMEAQQRDKSSRETEFGLEVFCYYHKEWELVSQVEYGSKANTATGLNTMCKVGVNQWTKQQRDFKESKADLLNKVMAQEIEATDLQTHIDELESVRTSIKPLIEFHEEQAYLFEETMQEQRDERRESDHEEALKMNK